MSAGRRRTGGTRAVRPAPALRPEPAPDRGPWSLARKAYTAIAALGVVIGVIAGALGLVDRLHGTPKAAPAAIDPEITSVSRDPGRTPLGDYLRFTHQPTASFSVAQLRQPGLQFEVGMRVRGLLQKQLTLEWAMYRARGGDVQRLHGKVYNQVAADAVPRSPDHRTTFPVWVPPPPAAGSYLVRFVLRDDRGLPVSTRDSAPIRYEG